MKSCPKEHTVPDLYIEVLPVGELPKLPPQVSLTDSSWPFLGSFALHVLLIAVASCPVFQYPLPVNSQTPAIFWFSLLSPPVGGEEAEPLLHGATAVSVSQQEAVEKETHPPKEAMTDVSAQADYQRPVPETPVDAAEPDLTIAAAPSVKKTVETVKPPPPPTATPLRSVPAPDLLSAPAPVQVKKLAVPLEAEPESPRALPSVKQTTADAAVSRASAVEKKQQKEDELPSRKITEHNQQAAESMRRERAVHEQELRATDERTGQEREAAEKARQKQVASENEMLRRRSLEESKHRQEAERVVRSRVEQVPLVVAANPKKTAPQQAQKESEPRNPLSSADKTMAMSLPIIKGDIKLVITGSVQPDATVTFVDFAQSRRDRPFKKVESRRFKKIEPQIVNTRDSTREVVIATSSPGVYTITALPAGETANVALLLKLYEGTSRAVSKNLGSHTVANKKTLCKILMPEGILWDDNAAFTGSIEDSDGVTKFNSESGLMWKEYAE